MPEDSEQQFDCTYTKGAGVGRAVSCEQNSLICSSSWMRAGRRGPFVWSIVSGFVDGGRLASHQVGFGYVNYKPLVAVTVDLPLRFERCVKRCYPTGGWTEKERGAIR